MTSSSEAVAALQALKLGKEAGDGEEGLWLFVCESVADQVDIMDQLQLAGCIMHDLGTRYTVGELVGAGASSKVFLAENLSTAEEVAVKIVSKKTIKDDIALLKEATILRWAVHESVLQYRAIYEVDDPATGQGAWAIVTEFVGGGELFQEVRQNGPLAEERTRVVIGQLLSALEFLHTRGIVHRDIKTENVCKTGLSDEIKLVDFGLATPEWDAEAMQMRCGTPGYIAPEVLKSQRYGCKVDCFSVGVLMYILLVGYGPFRGQTLEEMLVRNAKCKVDLQVLHHCTEGALDLVGKLLAAKAFKRPSAQEGLAQEWMKAFQPPMSLPTSRGSTVYPGGVAAAAQVAAMAVADRDAASGYAEPSPVLPSAALDTTSSSTSSVRRERRRLFSVSLSGMDMFFRDLRFSDGSPDDPDVDDVPAASGTLFEARPPPPALLPPLSKGSQVSVRRDELEEGFVVAPAPPPPAPLCTPASPSTPAPPLRTDRPTTPDSPSCLDGNSFGPCGQEAASLPHAVTDEGDDLAAGGYGNASASVEAEARRPSKDSQGSSENDEEIVAARVSGVEFRTCEPLWAGVQRTLESKRGQGVLPMAAGVKNIALRQRYADIMTGRAEAQDEEEVQRVSAFYTRDLRKKQSFSHSECSNKQLQAERVSAFFMRDLGKHGDEVLGAAYYNQASDPIGAELVERQSFNSAASSRYLPPLFNSEGANSAHGGIPGSSFHDRQMQAVASSQSVVSEERTSAFFTRWGAENRQAAPTESPNNASSLGARRVLGPQSLGDEDVNIHDPQVQDNEYLASAWVSQDEVRRSFE